MNAVMTATCSSVQNSFTIETKKMVKFVHLDNNR